MGQKAGEKWTAAAKLQPTFPKPDRLLGVWAAESQARVGPEKLAADFEAALAA